MNETTAATTTDQAKATDSGSLTEAPSNAPDGVDSSESPTTILPTAETEVSPTRELPAGPEQDLDRPAPDSSEGAGPTPTDTPPQPDLLSTKLQRSKDDRMISGVCGGFAKTLNIDALWLRLGLIVAVLLGFGIGLVVYLACWVLMPQED